MPDTRTGNQDASPLTLGATEFWVTQDGPGDRIPEDLRAAFDHWRDAAGEHDLPRRCDVDPPFAVPQLLPDMILIGIEDGPFTEQPDLQRRYRYRVHGTDLVRRTEQDLTGKYFDELYEDWHVARDYAIYREIETRRVGFYGARKSLVAKRQPFETYGRLLLPLLANDEDRVAMIWGLIHFPSATDGHGSLTSSPSLSVHKD